MYIFDINKIDLKKYIQCLINVYLDLCAKPLVFQQMFIIDRVEGDHVNLECFDISGSKYTPEGEV